MNRKLLMPIQIKRLLLIFLIGCCVFSYGGNPGKIPTVTVRVSGHGMTKTEALEDAFRNAVRKVVGSYVATRSKLEQGKYDEAIYINADAVVTDYKELGSSVKDGVYTITIEASVIKNNLLQHLTPQESSKVTSLEVGNLMNRRKALATADKTLEYIFENFTSEIITAKKVGNIKLASNDELDTEDVELNIDFELNFNSRQYTVFSQKLKALLSTIALAEKRGEIEYFEIYKLDCDGIKNLSHTIHQDKMETKYIIFLDKYVYKNKTIYRYHYFEIPKQILSKIMALLGVNNRAIVALNFNSAEQKTIVWHYGFSRLSFWTHGYISCGSGRYSDCDGIIFSNQILCLEFRQWRMTKKTRFTITGLFSEEKLRKVKDCEINIYTGQYADLLYYKSHREWSSMRDYLANSNYLPAMLALADANQDQKYWYSRAALMGSQEAQDELNWQNSGLGFEIALNRGQFQVWSVRKNVPVKRMMILKTLNGKDFQNDTENLAKFIGELQPGTPVEVEFTNGKKITVTAQPK